MQALAASCEELRARTGKPPLHAIALAQALAISLRAVFAMSGKELYEYDSGNFIVFRK
jgi:hypothetical protein